MNHRGGEASDAVEHSSGVRSHRRKWLKQRRLAKVTTAIATAAVVSAVGMGSLPGNIPVEIEAIFEVA